jgi:hypothetical protein
MKMTCLLDRDAVQPAFHNSSDRMRHLHLQSRQAQMYGKLGKESKAARGLMGDGGP